MRHFGFERKIALSLFKKETTYDAGVTPFDSTTAVQMCGFTSDIGEWEDSILNDAEDITCTDFPTQQEILRKVTTIPYAETKAKPNSIAGLGALVFGGIVTTQEGAFGGRVHQLFPQASSAILPSIEVKEDFGATQYTHTGVKGNSIKIFGKEDGLVGFEAMMKASGNRASSAVVLPPVIKESWLKTTQMKVFLESGAAISITPASQGVESISSVTPQDLKVIFKSFELEYSNELFLEHGYGSETIQEMNQQRRKCGLKFSIWFQNAQELDYFTNQTPIALQLDAAGGLIDPLGTFRYGLQIIVPKFQLAKAPIPKGGAKDGLSQDFECTVLSDGTNPVCMVNVYNGQAGYLL